MNDKFKNLLAEVFDIKASYININLTKEDIDCWDSLKQMDLVTSLEKTYSIRLDILDIVSMVSVEKIIEILKSKDVNVEN